MLIFETSFHLRRGYTSLHIAALQDQKEIVKALLKAGADIKVPCKTDGSFEDIMKKSASMKQVYDEVFAGKSRFSLSFLTHLFEPIEKEKAKEQNKPLPVPTKKTGSENSRISVALTNASAVEGFHPNLNRRSAQEKARAFGKNCFLLCPSDIHNCFVLTTFVDQKIRQYPIIPRPTGGYLIQGKMINQKCVL